MEHTKGPWTVKQLDDCFIEPRICEIPANGCYPYEFREANAKLIAAAPDLLSACSALTEALKMMREDSGITCGYNNFIVQGEQAIAKATQ